MTIQQPQFLPRLIRMKDAPAYLGMDKQVFNYTVRPLLTAIKVGQQGVAFDRLDLDAWVEHNKDCSRDLVSDKRR